MGDPVIHFEIGATDAARSRAFYSELFGWHIETDGDGYGVVHTHGDAGIGGGIVQSPPGVPAWSTFYVGVGDLDESLAHAEKLGGRRVVERTPVGSVGAFAMIADPDGNTVGLFEETPGAGAP